MDSLNENLNGDIKEENSVISNRRHSNGTVLMKNERQDNTNGIRDNCKNYTSFGSDTITPKSCSKENNLKNKSSNKKQCGRLFKCTECNFETSKIRQFNVHRRTHEPTRPHTCEICKKSFAKLSVMKRHRLGHDTTKAYLCDLCGRSFSQPMSLKYHKFNHLKDNLNKSSKKDETNVISDDSVPLKRFLCDMCGKCFSQAISLKVHKKKHTNVANESIKSEKSVKDGKGVLRTNTFNEQHLKNKCYEQRKSFKCSECSYTAVRSRDVYIHIRTHLGHNAFPCNMCDKQFLKRCLLKRHMDSHSNGNVANEEIKRDSKRNNNLRDKKDVYRDFSERVSNIDSNFCIREDSAIEKFEQLQRMDSTVRNSDEVLFSSLNKQPRVLKIEYPKKRRTKEETDRTKERERKPRIKNKHFCDQCPYSTKASRDLKVHKRKHTGEKPFPCGVCGKFFSNRHVVKRHQSVHTGIKAHFCEICGKSFSQASNLKSHKLNHFDENTGLPRERNRKFCKMKVINEKEDIKHDEEFIIDINNDASKANEAFEDNIDIKIEDNKEEKYLTGDVIANVDRNKDTVLKRFKYKKVKKKIKRNKSDKKHKKVNEMIDVNDNYNSSDDDVLGRLREELIKKRCKVDDLQLTEQVEFHDSDVNFFIKEDIRGIKRENEVDIEYGNDSEEFEDEYQMNDNIERIIRPNGENVYKSKEKIDNNLFNYIQSNDEQPNDIQEQEVKVKRLKKYKLKEKGEIKSYQSNDNHLNSQLELVQDSKMMKKRGRKPKENAPTSFDCAKCSYVASNKRGLAVHMTTHTKEKNYACEICGQRFSKQHVVKRHKLVHTGEKKFTCHYCGKLFTQSNGLKTHLLKHMDSKPQLQFVCDHCGDSFAQETSLKKHRHVHRRDKSSTRYSCHFCGKVFAYDCRLKEHLIMHTGEKRFSCDICNKMFLRLKDMRYHRLLHTEEKSCYCDVCGRPFATPKTLRLHKMMHSDIKPYSCEICNTSFGRLGHLQRHKVTHTGFKSHTCEICGKRFTQGSSLKRHTVTHSSERPFSCTICGKSYQLMTLLKKHMKNLKHGDESFASDENNINDKLVDNVSDKELVNSQKKLDSGQGIVESNVTSL